MSVLDARMQYLWRSFAVGSERVCLSSWDMVPYQNPHAWVLEDAERYEKPFEYEHKQGAVIWVHV